MGDGIKIEVSEKPGLEYHSNNVKFYPDDGCLSISGYDGLTYLNKNEAKALAEVLFTWARS